MNWREVIPGMWEIDLPGGATDHEDVIFAVVTNDKLQLTRMHSMSYNNHEGRNEPRETSGRLVRVLVIDPDPKMKPEHALIYNGGEWFTDRTNEEIWMGLALPELLEKHNKEVRKSFGLDPIRVGDLVKEIIRVWPRTDR